MAASLAEQDASNQIGERKNYQERAENNGVGIGGQALVNVAVQKEGECPDSATARTEAEEVAVEAERREAGQEVGRDKAQYSDESEKEQAGGEVVPG